ncbi:aminotransferase-like domain-containing protein [Reichenbachiella versicolor]|uniref:aminotransferase-like domain-containing protein n=1 Tax=Reichenbachiella versicolor TaxID=1821036 RepID=UPI000D6E8566|nr:PLP-dependent aminotransferase family protein [Reichenbachiella versicolor]
MLPWKSIIEINPESKRTIYLQISDFIIKEINIGHLSAGQKLPSSRTLADILKINRKTAIMAFDELLAQGWIDVIPNKGAFVKNNIPTFRPQDLGRKMNIPKIIKKDPISSLVTVNDGIPDYRLSLIDKLYKQAGSLSKNAIGKNLFGGGSPAGEESLRYVLCNYLHDSRAISTTPSNIMVTRGSQMALYLAFSILLKNGGKVAVGELNYQTANDTITTLGGKLVKIQLNDQGLDIDHLEATLQKEKIAAIYITPHHQYPTTITMPVTHRLRLLNLASKYDFTIIEDDYDYDYHYSRSPILPIASIDQESRVVYIGSFSKLFAPAVRLGYMVASQTFINNCIPHRLHIDRRGDPLLEKSLSMLIEDNELPRLLKKNISIYKRRRDLLASLLEKELGNQVRFKLPEGGMAIWVKFLNIDIDTLKDKLHQNGVIMNTDVYTAFNSHSRLGFASLNEKEIGIVIELLTKVIHQIVQ